MNKFIIGFVIGAAVAYIGHRSICNSADRVIKQNSK